MAKMLMVFQVNLLETRHPILNMMMVSLAIQPIDMKLAIDALSISKPISYFQYNILGCCELIKGKVKLEVCVPLFKSKYYSLVKLDARGSPFKLCLHKQENI